MSAPEAARLAPPRQPQVVADLVVFLHDYLGLTGVAAHTRLGEDVPFDSFAVVDVIAFVEAKYGVVVDSSALSIHDFATPAVIAERVARAA